jgi:acetolactate synthase-1/2/3 large subunit
MTTVAEAIVSILEAVEIDAGFGIPGGQTLAFYKAARQRGFRHVLVRDERNGSCAADAYARVSGKVGFCDATVGPGVTNLVSGLAEAYASSVPVLALIADVKTEQEHLRHRAVAMQSMEQRALLEPVCKWFGRVSKPEMLVDIMDHALRVATAGRPGPVVLEIPDDVMVAEIPNLDISRFNADSAIWPRNRPSAPASDIQQAVSLLGAAKRPIIVAGGGTVASGAYAAIERLASDMGIPVVTSLNGKGIIDERHPQSYGTVGLFGTTRGSHALTQADVVLAIGTKFTYFNTFAWKLPLKSQKVIHVDIDGEEIGRAIPAALGIVADAREALDQIADHLAAAGARFSWKPQGEIPKQPGTAPDDPNVAPEQIITAINEQFPDDTILISDASLASGWASTRYTLRKAGRHFLAPRGIGGLGWSCGAAIGAAMAAPEGTRIVVVSGDGAAAYWLGEIETTARLNLPITIVILNNGSLGWSVQIEQRMGIENVSRFAPTNFCAIGKAMGTGGARAESIDEVRSGLATALESNGPFVLDVRSSEAACATVTFDKLDPGNVAKDGSYGVG